MNKIRRQHVGRIPGGKSRPGNKLIAESHLVSLQDSLPTILSDYHTLANLLCVRQKLVGKANDRDLHWVSAAERGSAVKVAIGGFVKTLNQIACLLEFDRQEKSCGTVDPLIVNARLVGATRNNFVGPKSQPTCVRGAIQKIE